MVLINPVGVQAQGNVTWWAVPTIANEAAATATELNATSGLNISCFLYESSLESTIDQNKVDSMRRLCSRDTFQKLGNTTYTLGDLMYSIDPQAAPTTDGNKARTLLVAGTKLYLVRRLGKDAQSNDQAVSGDRYRSFYVQLGPQDERADTSNEANEVQIQQTVVVLKKPVDGVVAA